MIKPTIGRVLWLHRKNSLDPNQPEPVLVCSVHDDTRVNVAGFNSIGAPIAVQHCYLVQDDAPPPMDEPWCEWMPYQIGQAKKEEAKS